MNIDMKYIYVVIALLLTACGDPELVLTEPVPADGGLRFVATDGTRVSDEMIYAQFEYGEYVGCVIAKMENGQPVYMANSRWEYQGGVLIPQRLNPGTGWVNVKETNGQGAVPTDALLIAIDKSKSGDGFLKLVDTFNYAFYFYYPYYDDDWMLFSLNWTMQANGSLERCDLPYMPYHPNFQQMGGDVSANSLYNDADKWLMTGEVAQTYAGHSTTNTFSHYGWTAWPAFVCINQNDNYATPDVASSVHRRANNSNYMWTACTADTDHPALPINQTTATHTFPLVFHKKMAAIEIISADVITNVSIDAPDGLVVGRPLNLQTGTTGQYTPSTDVWTMPQQDKGVINHFITGYDWNQGGKPIYAVYPLRPRYMGLADGQHHRRLILPTQPFTGGQLSFTLSGTNYTLHIGEKMPKLEENKLYIIRLDHQGSYSLIINDWVDDQKNILLDQS